MLAEFMALARHKIAIRLHLMNHIKGPEFTDRHFVW